MPQVKKEFTCNGDCNEYRGWKLLEEMPKGWLFDETGSPLHGYVFVTDGKSVLNGQKRALLRVLNPQQPLSFASSQEPPKVTQNIKSAQSVQVIDQHYVRTVNELAREKFKNRLLNDILVDLTICEIEGWCKSEYIKQLKELIGGLGTAGIIEAVAA